jgi:hypothetical protein
MNLSFRWGGPRASHGSGGWKIGALISIAVSLAVGLSNCGTKNCTTAGCSSGANVTVVGAVAAWAPRFPVNLQVCADVCRLFRIERDDGGTICQSTTSPSALGGWECNLTGDGDAILVVPASSEGTRSISLVATNDANVPFFEGTASVVVTAVHPNGPDCEPTCLQGNTSVQP